MACHECTNKSSGFGCLTLLFVAWFAYLLGVDDGQVSCQATPPPPYCVAADK